MSEITTASQSKLFSREYWHSYGHDNTLGVQLRPQNTIQFLFEASQGTQQKRTIHLKDYDEYTHYSIPSWGNDKVVWINWRLAYGTVVTLTDHDSSNIQGDPPQIGGWGATVDLVGDGHDEWYSNCTQLDNFNMHNCLSSFFFRHDVDYKAGAIEIFQDANFKGIWTTIFLCEWEANKVHSIWDWWLCQRISSIRWRTMNNRQMARIFSKWDGKGSSYQFTGWSEEKECANLSDYRMNDLMEAFAWVGKNPKREYIEPFTIDTSHIRQGKMISTTHTGSNDSDEKQSVVLTLNKEFGQEITVETHDQHVVGISHTTNVSASVGVVSGSVEIGLSYQYTHDRTDKTVHTEKTGINIAQTVNIPARCNWDAKLQVLVGEIVPTVATTWADRWYDVELPGSTRDRALRLWKRRERVTVTVSGSLTARATTKIQTWKIDGAPTVSSGSSDNKKSGGGKKKKKKNSKDKMNTPKKGKKRR